MADTYEAELLEEARQVHIRDFVTDLMVGIIIKHLGMVNHWGRGRPGEAMLADIQRRVDELTGWVEE